MEEHLCAWIVLLYAFLCNVRTKYTCILMRFFMYLPTDKDNALILKSNFITLFSSSVFAWFYSNI